MTLQREGPPPSSALAPGPVSLGDKWWPRQACVGQLPVPRLSHVGLLWLPAGGADAELVENDLRWPSLALRQLQGLQQAPRVLQRWLPGGQACATSTLSGCPCPPRWELAVSLRAPTPGRTDATLTTHPALPLAHPFQGSEDQGNQQGHSFPGIRCV